MDYRIVFNLWKRIGIEGIELVFGNSSRDIDYFIRGMGKMYMSSMSIIFGTES